MALSRAAAAAVVRHFEEAVREHESMPKRMPAGERDYLNQRYEDRRERLVLRLMGEEP
jgi:hypothetical protein